MKLSVLVCLAFVGSTLTATAQMASNDVKELRDYQLSLPVLKQVVDASRLMAAAMEKDPQFQKLQKLEAELKALEAKSDPTDAELARIDALTEQLEESGEEGVDLGQARTISEAEAELKKQPVIYGALKASGLAPREYAKFMLAFMQAGMVHGMQKAGMMKGIPKEIEATVNPANLEFVRVHEKEIAAAMAEIEAFTKPRQ